MAVLVALSCATYSEDICNKFVAKFFRCWPVCTFVDLYGYYIVGIFLVSNLLCFSNAFCNSAIYCCRSSEYFESLFCDVPCLNRMYTWLLLDVVMRLLLLRFSLWTVNVHRLFRGLVVRVHFMGGVWISCSFAVWVIACIGWPAGSRCVFLPVVPLHF